MNQARLKDVPFFSSMSEHEEPLAEVTLARERRPGRHADLVGLLGDRRQVLLDGSRPEIRERVSKALAERRSSASS
jgi:hypothetical protein